MVGDVMLGRLVNETLRRRLPEYVWGDTLPLLMSGDLSTCNLECAISDRGEPWMPAYKPFRFRSDAKNVETLITAGIDYVSLGNNHTLDFGPDALHDTISILHDNAIGYSGAGFDLVEAASPFIREVEEERVAFISFTDNESSWAAAAGCPGIFYVPIQVDDERAEILMDLITETKKRTDLVVVTPHWGPNWGYLPAEGHIEFGRALIDAGADIVFGHSPHVFRGIEIYRQKPIIYAAGNFIDDYAVDPGERNDESFIFIIEENGGRIDKIELHPTVIHRFQAKLARGERGHRIAGKMEGLCRALGTPARWRSEITALAIEAAGSRHR
jgi:poly-gamma-glutamate synthesis protein (capsule biosynthesis protein)